MPSKERRRVLRIGSLRTSRGLTIPHGWAEFYGLEPGDELEILCDGILVVLPPGIPENEEKRVRAFLEGEA